MVWAKRHGRVIVFIAPVRVSRFIPVSLRLVGVKVILAIRSVIITLTRSVVVPGRCLVRGLRVIVALVVVVLGLLVRVVSVCSRVLLVLLHRLITCRRVALPTGRHRSALRGRHVVIEGSGARVGIARGSNGGSGNFPVQALTPAPSEAKECQGRQYTDNHQANHNKDTRNCPGVVEKGIGTA